MYDKIADWFDNHRDKTLNLERKIINIASPYLSVNSTILDIGCGVGEPIASYYLNCGHDVIGVDASTIMINKCKTRFPSGKWIVGDMRHKLFKHKFNIVFAWHSFFHIPQAEQPKTLAILCDYVCIGGLLIFTSGLDKGEVWSNNGGEKLYHASLSQKVYQKILEQNNFEILFFSAEDSDCGEATIWVAKKTP